MKKLLTGVAGLMLLGASNIVLADDDFPPVGSVSMSTVLSNLKSGGFMGVHDVEYDNAVFYVKAVDAKGQSVKLEVDAKTGKIIRDKDSKEAKLTMLDAVKKAESAGFQRIASVEADKENYELKALDKNNKEVELKINVTTGAITEKSDD